ncbi:hypothetical protein VB620_14880 [Nodularia harveyana UHCC-0300]|uniref:Lipoprotein n=1 Tax=Nodularia harveyana UHCC-0300 TaxID=2974287 RepID=A0ABU5UGE6_9CYAN|nr:hypothetical protein [Nodularia harveyana]MEA5582622.1 hypothetical protein [Nodularia harveyana UHCC-0300]
MKRLIPIFSVFLLLNSCLDISNNSDQIDIVAPPQGENCPPDTVVNLPDSQPEGRFYERFNYHIYNVLGDADTLKFQTLKQDFVFCRGNNTWTVQPGSLSPDLQPPSNYDAEELVNPSFKKIDFQGKTYQYRVLREPPFSLDENNLITRGKEPEAAEDKVVFELITPDNKTSHKQTIYTLKDLNAAALKMGFSASGNQLGFPRITSAVTYGESIWWTVSFEQGEGNNGIATIVSYDPQTNKFSLIQPEQLGFTQITDLVITGEAKNPTFWMGTQISSEGNPYIPAQGLVAYRPDLQNPNSGDLTTYTVENSPLVGAIPDKLWLENQQLWVSTANGVCQVAWETANSGDSWNCWRFVAMAKLPSEELPLYSASTNETPAVSLSPKNGDSTVEVLWWSPVDFQTAKGRYEVRYPEGFTVNLDEGASLDEFLLARGKLPVYWAGVSWRWNGVSAAPPQEARFVRGWDEVAVNFFGGGPQGIGSGEFSPNVPRNWNAMRGDLELLELSPQSTRLKYYSGWVDEAKLQPYLSVVPQTLPQNPQPNPLAAQAEKLQSRR